MTFLLAMALALQMLDADYEAATLRRNASQTQIEALIAEVVRRGDSSATILLFDAPSGRTTTCLWLESTHIECVRTVVTVTNEVSQVRVEAVVQHRDRAIADVVAGERTWVDATE